MTVGTTSAPSIDVTVALAQRLRSAADAALAQPPARADEPAEDADACLAALVARLRDTRDPALAWLVLTSLAGAYPMAEDVRHILRRVDLEDTTDLTLHVLDRADTIASEHASVRRHAVVTTGVVVDVDMCARHPFHNGIQRTAREVVRAWSTEHDTVLAAWTSSAGILRTLTPDEQELAARWDDSLRDRPASETDPDDETDIVIPWGATLVLAEVPLADRCPRLAALAEMSGTRVVCIGYDAIPVISADLRPLGEPNGFASYLAVIKHAARVAGISASAAEEFAGFGAALSAQGLPGPVVSEVTLPATVPPAPEGWVRVPPARPLALAVGRLEPHKNHTALLHAAERLWQEGVEFDLRLVGGAGWDTTRVEAQLDRLKRAGAPVTWDRTLGDDELWSLLRTASFTVFISLHEGFGLPVAESLACGTPVLTTSYGSQAQIAAAGGCLTVDPRDDESVLAGLRAMVTDPDLRARLRDEAAHYPVRTWQDYAADLWTDLVEGGAP
ncbi:glycosyltransferase [Cellulomonas fengjieae]|uniref:glycosyltransferase n=1 Tax=Cellulomonas fengjieae TaxID=2819978 RepID=UPI001AAFACA7|nr:glycosyltransferase [Cellulomonas fengjieae]MBO3101410.1 glycosyltransferase [Cellulomonas fengjieae]